MSDQAAAGAGGAAGAKGAPVQARPAATLALLRLGPDGEAQTLLGQRGGGASFMPSKVVFPGGALDPEDIGLAETIDALGEGPALDPRLEKAPEADGETGAPLPRIPGGPVPGPVLGLGLGLSAIRETFEETGLRLGRPGASPVELEAAEAARALGGDWRAFAGDAGAEAFVPAPEKLGFFFRAITPPSMPRRFDARFFVAFAGHLLGDPDDFSGASGELSTLGWTPLSKAAEYDLPFITHLVIAELQAIAAACAHLAGPEAQDGGLSQVAALMRRRPAPFFRHRISAGDPEPRARFEAV